MSYVLYPYVFLLGMKHSQYVLPSYIDAQVPLI